MMQATATYRPRSTSGQFVAVHITSAVFQSVEQITQMVFDRSQEMVPVLSGALKSSGKMKVEQLDKTVQGVVWYEEYYGPYVEFGTGVAGAASDGAGPGPYNPAWPGMPAQPFQRPAVDSTKSEAVQIFQGNIGVSLRA